MKKHMAGALAAVAVCLAAGLVYAGYDQAMGEIKSIDVDGGKLVIAVRAGRDAQPKDTTYAIDKETSVRIGREKKSLADLTVGKRASVVYKEAEGDGLPKALLISIFERRPRGNAGGGG
ncbi:MAG TPA: hypothetical protein VMZ92_03595 [Planctomycetota bacterium]|nr:hypothetical protein [Planctomycetota bacterium]